MPRAEPDKVRLAARLIAASQQGDKAEFVKLIDNFAEEGVQNATDGLIALAYICAGSIGQFTGKSFQNVLRSTHPIKLSLIPDVTEDWPEVVRLIECFGREKVIDLNEIDIPTALATAFSVASAMTYQLAELSDHDAEYFAVILSEASDPIALAKLLPESQPNKE